MWGFISANSPRENGRWDIDLSVALAREMALTWAFPSAKHF